MVETPLVDGICSDEVLAGYVLFWWEPQDCPCGVHRVVMIESSHGRRQDAVCTLIFYIKSTIVRSLVQDKPTRFMQCGTVVCFPAGLCRQ
jgi:hypothetical protein